MVESHTIYIEVDDETQYEELQRIKKKHGMTWKGLLLQGARRLEDDDAV